MKSKPEFLFSAGVLVAVVLAAFGYLDGTATASTAPPNVNLVRFHSPSTGPSDAKVHIVEFLDPACEGCKAFYPAVKGLLAEHRGKIRLSVRHVSFHKGADFAVRVLEASRKQWKYWEVLEALFASQSTWAVNHAVQPRLVLASLNGLGLDMQQLQRDMSAPEVQKLMEQDMADAKALKVAQTPDFYVNGKHLNPFGLDELRNLVRSEVKTAYP